MPRQHHLDLPFDLTAPRVARRHLSAHATTCPEELLAVALILTSELVTNSVRHGAPPVHLRVHDGPTRLRVEVADAAPDIPGSPFDHSSTSAEAGRGLPILHALADKWGTDPHPAASGKTIWFELLHG